MRRSRVATLWSMNDPIYKRLFSFRRMVADLLRAVGHSGWISEVDFGTLEKLPAEYVGERRQQRRGDTVWRVRFRSAWLYLLLLLEFQSEKDARMPLRNLEYTALLYGELDRAGELGPAGRWPPVLPLVLYNGETPWADTLEMRDLFAPVPEALAPYQPSQRSLVVDERRVVADDLPRGNLMRGVVGFEQSRTLDELARTARVLDGWLRYPDDADLALAFRDWMEAAAGRMEPDGRVNLGATLKEATMTLAERMAEWPRQWHREGVAEGLAEGRREGIAQGHREGQRTLLRHLAAKRFGDAVGDRLAALLGDTGDSDRLAAISDLIVTADAGEDLIRAAGGILRSGD